MTNAIKSQYGLTASNFILDPRVDSDFYAPRTGVDIPAIVESLKIDLVTDLPPKRMFWGLYGGGKTHTLYTVSRELGLLSGTRSVYVECPNVGRRSTFLHLYHDGIMASLGQDMVIGLLEELIEQIGHVRRDPLLAKLKSRVGSEEMARAVASLLGADSSKKLTLWRFLSGVGVPRQEIGGLEQTEDLTSAEPSRLADVIIMLGKILKEVRGVTLVLILDELDRLEQVGDETGSTFQNAFRRLVDANQKEVSVLMACSAGDLQQLPEVFGGGVYGPVLSRVGQAGLVNIPSLDIQDVDQFIIKVIQHLRNPDVDVTELIKRAQAAGVNENFNEQLFPFTVESLEVLKGVLRELMTPREIMQRMTQAIGKAYLMNRQAITSEVIA